jgi:RIO kinase 1
MVKPTMNNKWQYDHDDYDVYLEQFDPMLNDRQARRKRKTKARHEPKKNEQAIIEEIADTSETLEGGFNTTYQPSRYEEGWLLDSVRSFYEQALITDVVAKVKGGKEASVYRCQAHDSVDEPFLAAKVYRPRMFRQLRNDAMYREGRMLLNHDGKELTDRDKREMRAIKVKSGFGQQMAHTSWLMYEFNTLQKLHEAGASVPKAYANGMNALLMTYVGDEDMPAPPLSEVVLEVDEAHELFADAMRNIEIMLSHGMVHGDLSAYNILYWDRQITLIDFPQVSSIENNPSAEFILERDVTRVCDYFRKQGVDCDSDQITRELWEEYGVVRDTIFYEE